MPQVCAVAQTFQKVAGRILTHLEKYNSQVDRTFTTAMFSREAAAALEIDGDLADKDLTVLLKYLSRDRQVLVTDGKVNPAGLFR